MARHDWRIDPAGIGLPGYRRHWFWNVSIYGRACRIAAGVLATVTAVGAIAFAIIVTHFPTFGYPDCWGLCR